MPFEQKHKVKLLMHLPSGYSMVLAELGGGVGLAGGNAQMEIPTESIPPHLRKIGSRFLVIYRGLAGQLEAEQMTPDEIRSSISYRVLELTAEDD